ncbi:MAG TPA: MFS transporter [Dehalococcoidia bacterium]|nr:MFS transporter [Dehalococcoidia bacterium]
MSAPPARVPGRRSRGLDELRRAFASLGVYNYRLYYAGQFVSQTGTWMQRLAQAWLVLNITHSPFALGTVSMLQALPVTIFSLFGGVIADRVPKRKLLLVTQSVATVQAIVLASLTSFGVIQIWEIYVLALVLGTSNAFDNPARQSFPIELVGRGEVANAVALNSTLMNGSRILGPSFAGIAIATIGVGGCFWLNAVSFIAVMGSLIAMRPSEFFAMPKLQRGPTGKLLKEGIVYAIRSPAAFGLLFALLFVGTFGYNFNTFVPLVSRFILHTNSFQYGLLFSALGAGSLLAAVAVAFASTYRDRSVYMGGAGFMLLLAVLGISRNYAVSAAVLLLTGMASIVFSTALQTRLQLIVANEFRGRVMGIYTLLQQGSTPFGALFIRTISERWNVEAAVESAAAIGAFGLFWAWVYTRRHRSEGAAADALIRAHAE